jgi:Tol biopolymer transport system component
MKNSAGFFVLIITIIAACSQPRQEKLELTIAAADTVTLFAEGMVSTGYYERDFALSSSGNELYYTVQHPRTGFTAIMGSSKNNGAWSAPEIVSFSGNYSDLEPAFSPDGNRLYFASNRPKAEGATAGDFDIWFVDRAENSWGEPVNAGSVINSDGNEFYPSVARNGNLYFTGERADGVGKEDIFVSRYENGNYTEPVALDTAVNTARYEFNAFVSPDEDFLIFSSFGRSDDLGRGDLYISFADSAGNWLPAQNLGSKINSRYLDYCPFVTADRKYFFFASDRTDPQLFNNKSLNWKKYQELLDGTWNGNGNIYVINFSVVESLKK